MKARDEFEECPVNQHVSAVAEACLDLLGGGLNVVELAGQLLLYAASPAAADLEAEKSVVTAMLDELADLINARKLTNGQTVLVLAMLTLAVCEQFQRTEQAVRLQGGPVGNA